MDSKILIDKTLGGYLTAQKETVNKSESKPKYSFYNYKKWSWLKQDINNQAGIFKGVSGNVYLYYAKYHYAKPNEYFGWYKVADDNGKALPKSKWSSYRVIQCNQSKLSRQDQKWYKINVKCNNENHLL